MRLHFASGAARSEERRVGRGGAKRMRSERIPSWEPVATSRREAAVTSRTTSSVRLHLGCLKAQPDLQSAVASVRSIGWLRSARGFAKRRAQNMSLKVASRLRSAVALLFNLCVPAASKVSAFNELAAQQCVRADARKLCDFTSRRVR